jgi:hypothetical protein
MNPKNEQPYFKSENMDIEIVPFTCMGGGGVDVKLSSNIDKDLDVISIGKDDLTALLKCLDVLLSDAEL